MALTLRRRGKIWHVRGTVRIGPHIETVRQHSTGTTDRDTAESYLHKLRADVSHKLLFKVGGDPTKSAMAHESVGKGQTVYFLRARDGRIKIGVSGDHERRKWLLQNAHGEPLEVLAAIAGGRRLEQTFHALLAEYRTNGEWYQLPTEIACGIARVQKRFGRKSGQNPGYRLNGETRVKKEKPIPGKTLEAMQ